MTLTVKIMSGEDLPDDDNRKTYNLITGVARVGFSRPNPDGPPVLELIWATGLFERFVIDGNVYVMNEAGKTVSSFGCASPYVAVPPAVDDKTPARASS